jgi:hypothetical protein
LGLIAAGANLGGDELRPFLRFDIVPLTDKLD